MIVQCEKGGDYPHFPEFTIKCKLGETVICEIANNGKCWQSIEECYHFSQHPYDESCEKGPCLFTSGNKIKCIIVPTLKGKKMNILISKQPGSWECPVWWDCPVFRRAVQKILGRVPHIRYGVNAIGKTDGHAVVIEGDAEDLKLLRAARPELEVNPAERLLDRERECWRPLA